MMASARCVHDMVRGQCSTCRAAKAGRRTRSRAGKKAAAAFKTQAASSVTSRKKANRPPAQPSKAKAHSVGADVPDYDSGVRFSQDPDVATKEVWAFRTGQSYHRRDCHVIESRDGAVLISLAAAKRRRLERCMHCAPTVR